MLRYLILYLWCLLIFIVQVKNDDGWISMETMTKFKRLATLSTDAEVITAALRKSESKLIEVGQSSGY